ncbi:hypothetical protein LRR80_00691 [Streptomyces sp. RO-S4]|nr:hypothetical protein [Streptomyces sp. RO-S4]
MRASRRSRTACWRTRRPDRPRGAWCLAAHRVGREHPRPGGRVGCTGAVTGTPVRQNRRPAPAPGPATPAHVPGQRVRLHRLPAGPARRKAPHRLAEPARPDRQNPCAEPGPAGIPLHRCPVGRPADVRSTGELKRAAEVPLHRCPAGPARRNPPHRSAGSTRRNPPHRRAQPARPGPLHRLPAGWVRRNPRTRLLARPAEIRAPVRWIDPPESTHRRAEPARRGPDAPVSRAVLGAARPEYGHARCPPVRPGRRRP